MKRVSLALVLILVSIFVTGCLEIERFPAKYSETQQFTVALPAGGTLHVSTQNGSIKVRSGDVTDVQITAEKTVHSRTEEEAKQFCEKMKVQAEAQAVGATVSVALPEGYRGRAMIAVSFETVVPKNCNLDLDTSNGEVRAREVAGNAEMRTSNGLIAAEDIGGKVLAVTSNGRIELKRVSGSAEARTSNGNVTIAQAGGDIRCETSNGSITLEKVLASAEAATSNGNVTCSLPADASATVSAHTANGKLSCEFPVAIKDNRVSGKIGDGKFFIRLRTTNGNVSIQRIE